MAKPVAYLFDRLLEASLTGGFPLESSGKVIDLFALSKRCHAVACRIVYHLHCDLPKGRESFSVHTGSNVAAAFFAKDSLPSPCAIQAKAISFVRVQPMSC